MAEGPKGIQEEAGDAYILIEHVRMLGTGT